MVGSSSEKGSIYSRGVLKMSTALCKMSALLAQPGANVLCGDSLQKGVGDMVVAIPAAWGRVLRGISSGFGRSSERAEPRGSALEWWVGRGMGTALGSSKVTTVSEITWSHPAVPLQWLEVMSSTFPSSLSAEGLSCVLAEVRCQCGGAQGGDYLLEVQVSLAPALPCWAGVSAQPQSLGLAPGLLCTGVMSKARFPVPSLPSPCLQGGRSNRVQIMKPKSYSPIIPHLRQMHFITVLGGVSKCQAGGSPALCGSRQGWSGRGGPMCCEFVARPPAPLVPQPQGTPRAGGTKAPSWVPKQSCSFPWVMSVSEDQHWDLESQRMRMSKGGA